MIPVNQQSSSIWKVGKEGGKCNFLLFDDKWVPTLILVRHHEGVYLPMPCLVCRYPHAPLERHG